MSNPIIPALNSKWLQKWLSDATGHQNILLAVSGGIDSMVLWYLLDQTKLKYSVAHVNYNLRGKDSDLDAALIQKTAKLRKVKVHLLESEEINKTTSNLQDKARKIRYDFFRKLSADYPILLTAHHANDHAETVLMKLGKGRGPQSLTGIQAKNKAILRPLITFTKQQILAFAKAHNIEYREDRSNFSDDYLRNRIRHHLLPICENLFKDFTNQILKTSEQQNSLLSFARAMVNEQVGKYRSKKWPHCLNRTELKNQSGLSYLIHELLHKHSFSKEIQTEIYLAIIDTKSQKRRFFNNSKNIALIITGQTIHLETTVSVERFAIDVAKVGRHDSPLGHLVITKVETEQKYSNKVLDVCYVSSLKNLTWSTLSGNESIQISAKNASPTKKVIAAAKLPNAELGRCSGVFQDNKLVWIPQTRKAYTNDPEKIYCIRFYPENETSGLIQFISPF